MDHLTILIWLIGVVMFTPFCINGRAPNTEQSPPECRPPTIQCARFCGDSMMTVYKQVCDTNSRWRLRPGIVWTIPQIVIIAWILTATSHSVIFNIFSVIFNVYGLTAVLLVCVLGIYIHIYTIDYAHGTVIFTSSSNFDDIKRNLTMTSTILQLGFAKMNQSLIPKKVLTQKRCFLEE